jgi:ABC-type glycerol-3-phosphate transport system permease component
MAADLVDADRARRRSLSAGSSHAAALVALLLKYALMILLGIVMVTPFLWMISTSLKPPDQIARIPPEWIPSRLVWKNYLDAWTAVPFALFMLNSAKVSVLAVLGSLFVSSLAGYSFAKVKFPGSGVLFGFLLATLMIPSAVRLIPLYIVFRHIKWIDTHLTLIVPPIVASTFGVFLMRQFFITLPNELEDSAWVDGCGLWQSYRSIMLPLARPALGVLAIFMFMGSWNQLLGPLIFINTLEKMTAPLGLAVFQGEFGTLWGPLMAGSTIIMAPIMVVYMLFERTFTEGIALQGLKE